MKLLLDTCTWSGACAALEQAGHDVIWAGDWPEDPGDDEILPHAEREGRVLVALDKDFGELAIVHGMPLAGSYGWSISPFDSRPPPVCASWNCTVTSWPRVLSSPRSPDV